MTAARWVRSITRRWRRTSLELHYEQLDRQVLRNQLDDALGGPDDADVPLSLLLNVATLRASQFRASDEKRALGQEFHDPLIAKWRKKHPTSTISASPPQAMIVLHRTGQPELKISMSPVAAPDFDWSIGRLLLNRVDAVGDRARSWIHDREGQIPHMERAYALATQVLAAVQRERWRREATGLTPTHPPTEAFVTELRGVEPQIASAEELFELGATQDTQNTYVNGMLVGAAAVALFCGVGGWLLYHYDEPAVTGVAFATGALGAVISVLQRLTKGNLELDFREPSRRVRFSGAVRPWVGAVFGMVLFALLQSGLFGLEVNPPDDKGPELAYFGVLGFIAGFNERFAQDVVSTSAGGLGTTLSTPQSGAPAAQTG